MGINTIPALTDSERRAIFATNELVSSRDAARNGNYKMLALIARNREAAGFSEADIFEGLAMGVESATDAAYWQFKVLEYINRYTTKYGAVIVLVVGVYTVLKKAGEMASSLFSMLFGGSGDTSKDMYHKDKTVRDAWFFSGGNQAQMTSALADGLLAMLPPGMSQVVKSVTGESSSNGVIGQAVTYGSQLAANVAGGPAGAGVSAAAAILKALGIQDATRRDRTVRDGNPQGARPMRNGIAQPLI